MRVATAALVASLLAVPVWSQETQTDPPCAAVWAALSVGMADLAPVTGTMAAPRDGWCVIDAVRIDLGGQYTPDILADRLRLRGTALAWLQDRSTAPDSLSLELDGLRFVVQTGQPQMDYLMAAQAGANRVAVKADLTWTATSRSLALERLEIDFPGANLLTLTARAIGVDLSSPGAAQMSVASFAITDVDLMVQTHGLFEAYVLMAAGAALLPPEGDMQAAEADLKAQAAEGIAALPPATFSDASKRALLTLLDELPNPSGTFTLALRSGPGVGPARLMGFAVTGVPVTMAAAAPLFDGVTVDIGWTHADTP